MKTLNQIETIQAIIDYIKERKSNNELFLDYYKNNDVFDDYEKLYNTRLYKPNKNKNKKYFKRELFKKDLNDVLNEMKDTHLKIKNSSIIKNLNFVQDRNNKKYYITGLNINCCENWSIKTRMGIEIDTLKFYSCVGLFEKTNLFHYDKFIFEGKQRKADSWFKEFSKYNDIFYTKNLSISINEITKDKIKEVISNIFIDAEKSVIKSKDVILPILKIISSNSRQELMKIMGLSNYVDFKNSNQILSLREDDLVYIYNNQNLYLKLLKEEFPKINNSSVLTIEEDFIYGLSIKPNNIYLKLLSNINYNIVFKNDFNDGSFYLYRNGEEILNIPMEDEDKKNPNKLYSFIESDMISRLEKTINKSALSILEECIKFNIKNKLIDIKVILENVDFTSMDKNSIPIEIVYNNNKMEISYNELEDENINKEINTFVGNQLLLNIVKKNKHKVIKNRL